MGRPRQWWGLGPGQRPFLSRAWGLFLLSAFPVHDSTQGWACGFPVAAWESRATWRAGRSPRPRHLVPSDSLSVPSQGPGDACELSTPRTTQSSRPSQEHGCYLSMGKMRQTNTIKYPCASSGMGTGVGTGSQHCPRGEIRGRGKTRQSQDQTHRSRDHSSEVAGQQGPLGAAKGEVVYMYLYNSQGVTAGYIIYTHTYRHTDGASAETEAHASSSARDWEYIS